MIRRLASALGLVLLAAGSGWAQSAARPQPSSFRVEWEPRAGFWRPGIEGYVYNESEYRVGNVRLRIIVSDGSGVHVGEKSTWIYGAIDSRGRAYFVGPPLEAGQSYTITVESFDVLARQAP